MRKAVYNSNSPLSCWWGTLLPGTIVQVISYGDDGCKVRVEGTELVYWVDISKLKNL
jgi:hypothetical protein